ncbi:MAG: DUF2868 domain-containing protein [Myxococcales bacterium]|nr:DUF2868 domain-containing protein [Myxococcales bacterium]
MKLFDLIDLEAQLAWDRGADESAIAARDAAIAARLSPEDRATPARAVAAWLEALRVDEEGAFPGKAVARALRVLSLLLAIFGFFVGAGLATALLAYDGTRPINVMDFLWVVVGVQLVLLLVLVLAFVAPRVVEVVPFIGDVRAILRLAYRRLAARFVGTRGEAWAAAFHRLKSRRSLYARIEPWILLGLTQTFGVAFNLGVLAVLLRLVALTDLAFSWATTLDLDAASLHRVVEALAAPWASLYPEAVPSRALVESTRYSRQIGAYLAESGAALSGGWWPFLVAATVTYGLLPRLAALVLAHVQRARGLSGVRFDDLETRRLVARLTSPVVETRGTGRPEEAPILDASAALPTLALGEACVVVLYRDVPAERPLLDEALRSAFGVEVREAFSLRGAEPEAVSTIGAMGAPVVVFAEAWEPPDKSVLGLLRALREALSPRTPVVVALVGVPTGGGYGAPSDDELVVWKDRLASLEDPFLGIEALGGSR